tara:strand:- start:1149 stop:4616 length:3468 start_codon:yes stop_codon:yes gene_type:complete
MARSSNTGVESLLFKSGIRRNRKNSAPVRSVTLEGVDEKASPLTGTFRYDSPGSALKSTQQLNVDFSNFSNHTFFNSAEAKVQKAFDKIINKMPFDGTFSEIVAFVDSLTGFEKYVYNQFPSRSGYLAFSGSASPSSPGTFIEVKDFKGSTTPTLSKNPTGEGVLDPKNSPFTLEFHFSVPGIANDNQIVFQKKSSNNGITVYLEESSSTETANLVMAVISGSQSLKTSMEITKGNFQHVAAVFDKSAGPGQLFLYRDAALESSSSFAAIGSIDFTTSPLYIGSGSSQTIAGTVMTPAETLSGALDDIRFWHKRKTQKEIRKQQYQEVFAQKDLKLLFRLNEPSGTFSGNGSNLVLDYSGNSLHSSISNFSMNQRSTDTFGSSPMSGESRASTISLFPSFSSLTSLNSSFLTEAKQYDASNPNIVTRLIPPHYLRDASSFEGFESENAGLSDDIGTAIDQPGGATVGQPQIIAAILFTFAESFDELKMFIDEFKRLLKVDVLTNETVSNQLLPWLSRYYGVDLPEMFGALSAEQFLDGKNVRQDRTTTTAIQTVQNMLWRRIFSDLPYLLSSRGTMASVRSLLSNLGISPNGPIRIREYGGSSIRNLGDSFIRRHEIAAMLNMSGTLADAGTVNPQGIDPGRPFLQSSFLSGSRTEPGKPEAWGTQGELGTSQVSDGYFTSGSWTFEGRYKFTNKISHTTKQSLVRIHTTGSLGNEHNVMYNCVARKPVPLSSITGSVTLFGRPNSVTDSEGLNLTLTGVDIFDGGKWQISFGRNRNDLIDTYTSSSYFLRASKFSPAGLEQFYTTSSYFDDGARNGTNYAQKFSENYNSSGTFLVIGSQSINTSSNAFLNDTVNNDYPESRYTTFTGMLSSLRFYSKGLSEEETKTHSKNFKSVGVKDPEANFSFVTNTSGSFQKLRLDVSLDQPITESDSSGEITGFDFSQNSNTFAGTGFESSKRVILPERFDFDVLSSNFQSGENPNKIRVRSYKSLENVRESGASFAPLHDIPQNEQPQDDNRVAVEISVTQGLNEDIMNIFSTLNALDNLIGSPELVFSQDYPSLRNLRRIYFNRLTKKVNFLSFFEFFKFFDDTIGDILEQMIPGDTRFLGSSYVIESHALERAKFSYKYYDLYLGEEDRGGKEVIRLQQIVGSLRKF